MWWMTIISAISGIVSLGVMAFSDTHKALISLIAIIFFLLAILCSIWYTINKFLQNNYPKEFLILSQFSKYIYKDETHMTLDAYRLIQSKKTFLSSCNWGFSWTGKHDPIIKSDLQKCDGKIIKSSSNGGYDHILLKFDKPLFYNESAVVHFHADMIDTEGIAQPHLDIKIEEPRSVVDYRVILAYKDSSFNKNATFKRRLIHSSTPNEFEEIAVVPFNAISKSYDYVLTNPEIGYFYRLEWEK